jgi:catechol 2,3-dioxygenase-like lactoylglutathione lyase family enzyme
MTEEIYPMPLFPMLVASDLEASARFYQEALGFTHIFTMPGPGGTAGLVHLRWVKYADLLLTRARASQPVSEPRGLGVTLSFNLFDRFGGRMDALAEHARQHGANVTGPVDQPWNVHELTVLDPDGYRLVFTSPINIGANFNEVIEQAKGSM